MDTKETLKHRIYTAAGKVLRWIAGCWDIIMITFLGLCLIGGGIWYVMRHISQEEMALRRSLITAAESYWGKNKGRSMEGLLVKATKVCAVLFILLAIILGGALSC